MSGSTTIDRVSALVSRPVEHDGQRVVTLAQVDDVHGRPDGTAGRNFRENRARFTEGRDYFVATREGFPSTFGVDGNSTRFAGEILLTERGYVKVTKPMRDPLAWEVMDQVLDGYFAGRGVLGILAQLSEKLAGVEGELAMVRGEVKTARADTHAIAVELKQSRSRIATELGKQIEPRFRVLAEEDPKQGRIFLNYSQIVEDRARLAAGRITSTEAAALLGVTVRQLGRMAKDGKVERRHPGTRRPYLIEHVQRALVPAGESVAS